MSTAVLPSLAGLGFNVVRSPVWDTVVQQAIGGMETRIARQSYPRWKWELTYNILRSNATYGELQALAGFFNQRQGMFDTFLYTDADDHTVTGQSIGVGDGVTTQFQLVRTFGGFTEPVLAPASLNAVYLDGYLQSPSSYSVCLWGGSVPGALTFTNAPAANGTVSVDLAYYWPCRMSDDSVSFTLFMSQYYKAQKFSFMSVKN